jgi:hypothetical protein
VTRATVATLKAEAKRFIAVLDRAEYYPESDKYYAGKPKHGHTAKVRRASLTLGQILADYRQGRLS